MDHQSSDIIIYDVIIIYACEEKTHLGNLRLQKIILSLLCDKKIIDALNAVQISYTRVV